MAGTGDAHLRPSEDPILSVTDLTVEFPSGRGRSVKAVSGISFDVVAGETLGLVGESGCGKSTTGKAILQLPRPTAGSVRFEGVELTALREGTSPWNRSPILLGRGGVNVDLERAADLATSVRRPPPNDLRSMRQRMQLIFQDPISSLNPRRRVADIVAEPLRIWGIGTEAERKAKVEEVLSTVGLDPAIAGPKRPHQFSGGQCQRISIARSLVLEPDLVICDEPVSALDVSVQAQILNLLEDMKARYGLTLIFIAHDLAVVKNVSDRVAVMYLGKLCEVAAPDSLYTRPAHPYTAALLSAIPVADPEASHRHRIELPGDPPSPIDPPSGCRFRTRCPRATEQCAAEEPKLRAVLGGSGDRPHFVACHHPLIEAAPETAVTVQSAPT